MGSFEFDPFAKDLLAASEVSKSSRGLIDYYADLYGDGLRSLIFGFSGFSLYRQRGEVLLSKFIVQTISASEGKYFRDELTVTQKLSIGAHAQDASERWAQGMGRFREKAAPSIQGIALGIVGVHAVVWSTSVGFVKKGQEVLNLGLSEFEEEVIEPLRERAQRATP